MIFGRAVEFPAPRRSPEVLVHSPAAPGVPPLPGVARRAGAGAGAGPGARRAAAPGTHGIQQAQQHQQRYHQHCVMTGVRRLGLKRNGGVLPDSQGPIKVSGGGRGGPDRWSAPALRAHTRAAADSSAVLASLLQVQVPPVDPSESPRRRLSADIKEAGGDNGLNSDQLIQRGKGEGGAKGISPV